MNEATCREWFGPVDSRGAMMVRPVFSMMPAEAAEAIRPAMPLVTGKPSPSLAHTAAVVNVGSSMPRSA